MGLISALTGAGKSLLGDQWKEYFYCDSIDNNVLVVKGEKKVSGAFGTNKKGADNIISNGSVIAVNVGQCMIIVDQGKVVELCAEPGEFVYDTSSEPSIFYGNFGENIMNSFKTFGKRITFGGDTGKDQRVYYFNTKEMLDNKFGTPAPIPFRVVMERMHIDVDFSVRCNGSYSLKVVDPILFYTNVCGNVQDEYTMDELKGQLLSELLDALGPAFSELSSAGVRYSAIPGHQQELREAVNKQVSAKWNELRGISIVSMAINSITMPDDEKERYNKFQDQYTNASMMSDPTLAAGRLVSAQANAMEAAAANESTGPMMAFAGMNMAMGAGGMNANNLFQMGQQQQQAQQMAAPTQAVGWTCECGTGGNAGKFCQNCGKPQPAPAGTWKCECGHDGNSAKFCQNCGKPKPGEVAGWTCECGKINPGKFCQECGKPKPAGAPLYRCDKCGWEPEDPANPPKFCQECGDIFDENDVK